MKNTHTVLEISHKYIKVLIATVHNGKVAVNYCKKIPTSHYIENGSIRDRASLINALTKINPLIDEQYHINQMLDDVVLLLPPYGLEIYRTMQTTSVIAPEKVIGALDIKNIFSIIRNKKLPVNNDLINIIVDSFKIDNGNRYASAPIGKSSSAITADVRVYTLPRRINAEYSEVVKNAGIKVSDKIISTHGAIELLKNQPDTPEYYFLVDIGGSTTSVSLASKKELLGSRSFSWGGDNITSKVMESINITEKEAEKIKKIYGYDKREMSFKFPLVSIDEGEEKKNFYREDLNKIIAEELDGFIALLKATVEQLKKTYNVPDGLPLLLTGGGSKLIGLVDYLSENLSANISLCAPKEIGARDPSMISLLGAALIKDKYLNELDDTNTQANVVTREE